MSSIIGSLMAIDNGDKQYVDDVFSIYLYTGNGSSQDIVNGINLAGEGGMVWIKSRSNTNVHALFDTERGVTNLLKTDSTQAQVTSVNSLTAFNPSGFSLGSDANLIVNHNTITYASWTFRKAPRFFDIVTYTGDGVAGREIAHELGCEPGMIVVKSLNQTQDWVVYHRALGATKYLKLSKTDAEITANLVWNDTEPTNTHFTISDNSVINSGSPGMYYVAYLFATLPGISKVGSYTGNGTSQTIDCGFATGAKFILIKRTDSIGDWYFWDTARGIVDANDPHLSVNTTASEVTTDDSVDPDTSGFLVNQVAATNINVTAGSYVFLAIA